MTEIICSALTAIATIVCAWIGRTVQKNQKETLDRAEKRAKEGKLQLAMIGADMELTKGIAYALQNGKCNGEVHKGLEEIEKAQAEYRKFLEESALDDIRA